MPPFVEHPHHLFRDLAFFQKHPENLVPENGLQLFEFQRRRDSEHPFVAVKTSVRQKYVAVRIEPEKIAEGLDGDDRGRNRIFFGNRIPDKDLQGFSGAAAEAYKKFSIIQKMTAKNLGNTEYEMPVGYLLRTSMQSHSPNSTTRFWWQDGQKNFSKPPQASRLSVFLLSESVPFAFNPPCSRLRLAGQLPFSYSLIWNLYRLLIIPLTTPLTLLPTHCSFHCLL